MNKGNKYKERSLKTTDLVSIETYFSIFVGIRLILRNLNIRLEASLRGKG